MRSRLFCHGIERLSVVKPCDCRSERGEEAAKGSVQRPIQILLPMREITKLPAKLQRTIAKPNSLQTSAPGEYVEHSYGKRNRRAQARHITIEYMSSNSQEPEQLSRVAGSPGLRVAVREEQVRFRNAFQRRQHRNLSHYGKVGTRRAGESCVENAAARNNTTRS